MREQEQRELDRIACVFEKFLYTKILAEAGYTAEGLRLVWLDRDAQEPPAAERPG